eukprot:6205986-Pleurochrysis_carterae.AAC.3
MARKRGSCAQRHAQVLEKCSAMTVNIKGSQRVWAASGQFFECAKRCACAGLRTSQDDACTGV